MPRKRPLLLFLVLFAAFLVPESPRLQGDSSYSSPAEVKARLKKLEAKMEKEKADLEKLMADKGRLVEKLDALERALRKSRKRLSRLKREKQALNAEARELREKTEELSREVDELKDFMARRIKARYRFERSGLLPFIFAARDINTFARTRKYLQAVYRADARRMMEYRLLLEEWRRAGEELEARLDSLSYLEKLRKKEQLAMEKRRKEYEQTLRRVQEEKAAHEAALKELSAAAQRLQELLEDLEKASGTLGEGEDFAALKGLLCPPAAGPIVEKFGKRVHPRFNTVTMHNGVEIKTEQGAAVRAVAEGTTRFASWFRGYGNIVILQHRGGYYTVYGHLDRIDTRPGDKVKKGQVIGIAGQTGSLRGPSLYFEIRHHKKSLDPEEWFGPCDF